MALSANCRDIRREGLAHVFSDSRIERVEAPGREGIEPALCDAFDFVVLDAGTVRAAICGGR